MMIFSLVLIKGLQAVLAIYPSLVKVTCMMPDIPVKMVRGYMV